MELSQKDCSNLVVNTSSNVSACVCVCVCGMCACGNVCVCVLVFVVLCLASHVLFTDPDTQQKGTLWPKCKRHFVSVNMC